MILPERYTWPPGRPRKKRLDMRSQDFPKIKLPHGKGDAPIHCARPGCAALTTLSCASCFAQARRRTVINGSHVVVRYFLEKAWCRRHAPCWKGNRPYCSDDCAARGAAPPAKTGRPRTAA